MPEGEEKGRDWAGFGDFDDGAMGLLEVMLLMGQRTGVGHMGVESERWNLDIGSACKY